MKARLSLAAGVFITGYVCSTMAMALSMFEIWLPWRAVLMFGLMTVFGAAWLVRLTMQFLKGAA